MLQRCEEFLRTILPEAGLRCVVVLNGKRPLQRFFSTNSEAAAFSLKQDARKTNVYHACATFKDASSRRAENVHSVRSLWLDVDCGPDKPYAGVRAGLDNLRSFLERTGLPKPAIVGSGGGLHLYWPLRDSLLPGEWLGYARGLKRQCEVHGFRADPARTCDAASILRPVGTHNRKTGDAVQVVWDGPEGPYEIEAFESLLSVPGMGSAARPSYLPPPSVDVFRKAKVEYETEPADANEVANRCAQIGACRDARGALSEPLWRSALGVISWCANGAAIAHAWSEGDERYDPVETQGKIDRLLKLTGPTTCKQFQAVAPEGCRGCKYALEVSTPLELGRAPYTAPLEAPRVGVFQECKPLSYPEGFACDASGLYFLSEKDDKQVKKLVSRTQFQMVRIAQVDNEQQGAHYVFQLEHKHDGVREIVAPAATVHSSQGVAYMAGSGVPIENNDLFRTYINAACALLRDRGKAAVTYKQYGWKDDGSFIVGGRSYSHSGVCASATIGAAQDRSKHFQIKGTLEEWTGAANMLCAPGCEAQQFTILASAAAPLMRFHAQDEGGAIFSQASRESATGKTTSFDAGQSFWGDKDGLAIGSTATQNARGIILATSCNLPVFFDEASQRDSDELRNFIQVFTDGTDRQRARVDGLLNQNPLTWQTVLLCGSNAPMLEVLGSVGGSDAMMYRILEVCPSLPPGLTNNGEKLRRILKANSGQAGDRYMKFLVGNAKVTAFAKYWLEKYYDEIGKTGGFDRKMRFIIRLLASVRVAGEIVKKAGILACNPERMMQWGIEKAKAQTQDIPTFSATDALTAYLNYYHDDILTVMDEGRKGGQVMHPPKREIRGRYEVLTRALYIPLPPFRKWLATKDFSWTEVREGLKTSDLLDNIKLVTLTAGTDIPGGQLQCMQLRAERLGFVYDREKKSNVVELKR